MVLLLSLLTLLLRLRPLVTVAPATDQREPMVCRLPVSDGSVHWSARFHPFTETAV